MYGRGVGRKERKGRRKERMYTAECKLNNEKRVRSIEEREREARSFIRQIMYRTKYIDNIDHYFACRQSHNFYIEGWMEGKVIIICPAICDGKNIVYTINKNNRFIRELFDILWTHFEFIIRLLCISSRACTLH